MGTCEHISVWVVWQSHSLYFAGASGTILTYAIPLNDKSEKVFLQFVCEQLGKRWLPTGNYADGQLALEVKSPMNVILKVVAYEIWDFKKEKISIWMNNKRFACRQHIICTCIYGTY